MKLIECCQVLTEHGRKQSQSLGQLNMATYSKCHRGVPPSLTSGVFKAARDKNCVINNFYNMYSEAGSLDRDYMNEGDFKQNN